MIETNIEFLFFNQNTKNESRVIMETKKCNHLWLYGNIAKEKGEHPRVRECAKCKKFEYVKL